MKQINWFVGQWRFVFNKIDASVQCNVSLLILVADLTSFLGLKYVHGVSADLSCTPYERVWMCMRAFKWAYMSASESQVGQSVAHSSYVTGILPQLSQHLSWSTILSDLSSWHCVYDCLIQLWRVAILTMLASTGLTVKQRVTLRRNGRDVEVSSFISLILTLLMLRSRAVWTSARPRETQSPASCVCSRRRRWTPCWRSPFWNAHIGQKTKKWIYCLN